MECPVCGFRNEAFSIRRSKCKFTGMSLERYACPSCEVVFGPLSMLGLSFEDMKTEYDRLYSSYGEGDTTEYEVRTFASMNPTKSGTYLNFGAGKWSSSTKVLRNQGYNLVPYDPFVLGNEDALKGRYDGIFSHNVIEHLQTPIKTFGDMAKMLYPNGKMAHSTACYGYRYEYSKYHLFFFLGKSIEVLADRTGFSMEGKEERLLDGDYVRRNFLRR